MATSTQKNQKTLQQKPSLKRRIFAWLFNVILICGLFIASYVAYIYMRMPSLDAILHETRPAA